MTDHEEIDFVGVKLARATLLRWGTEEQRARYLPGIDTGSERWCQLFSEPGAGSDLASLCTRAELVDGHWVVNGQKVWTSGASGADHGLLLARTDPDVARHRGISYFVVDMHASGVEVRPLRGMDGEAHFSEVFFDDVVVPASAVVGAVGDGWRVAMSTLLTERAGLSEAPQVHPVLLDDLIAAARSADLLPAERDRVVRRWIEDRVLEYTAARAVGSGSEHIGSLTKLLRSELAQRSADAGLDLLGAAGLAWEDGTDAHAPTRLGFLYAPAHTIAGGTSEIQRTIIGERVLGLPREPA